MKKIVLGVSALAIALALAVDAPAGSRVKCYGDCNKAKRACEAKAKRAKYSKKDGMKKAILKCEAEQEKCKKKCS